MFKDLLFRKLKLWLRYIIPYILGFATALSIGAILTIYYPDPTINQRKLIKNWQLYENSDGLNIKLHDVNNNQLLVNIKCIQKINELEKIYLIKDNKIIFQYLSADAKLDLGSKIFDLNPSNISPMVAYGWYERGMSGYIWKDINFDSMFDERFGPGGYEILIDDKWVRAKRPDMKVPKVETSQGNYEFDFTIGQWNPVK